MFLNEFHYFSHLAEIMKFNEPDSFPDLVPLKIILYKFIVTATKVATKVHSYE